MDVEKLDLLKVTKEWPRTDTKGEKSLSSTPTLTHSSSSLQWPNGELLVWGLHRATGGSPTHPPLKLPHQRHIGTGDWGISMALTDFAIVIQYVESPWDAVVN